MQLGTTQEQAHDGMPGEILELLAAAERGLGSAPRASTVRGGVAQWAQVVEASQRVMNLAAAVQDEAIVALAAIEPEPLEDGTVVEAHRAPGHVALDAPAIVSGALAVSAVHAERRVRAAVRLVADGTTGSDTETGLGGLHSAMRTGVLDAYRASVVADELELAPPQVAAAVVAALGEHLGTDAAPQLRRRCRTVLSRVSPDLVVRRAEQARERCALRRWAEEPGIDKWEGTFPSQDAARAWAAIDDRAHELVADGTCPRIDRARSQALIDLVTGSATITTVLTLTVPAPPDGPGPHRPAAADPSEPEGGPATDPAPASTSAPVEGSVARGPATASGSPDDLVEVSMGSRGEPVLVTRAFLEVVARSLDTTTVRRVCHPGSGALLDHTAADSYRPPAALAALVRQRDGRCRFPGCHVSARFCDLDHVRPWPNGPTTAANLVCLCRRHHRVKQRPGWRVRLHPDATLTWTDPTGRGRTTHPLDALHALVLHAPTRAESTAQRHGAVVPVNAVDPPRAGSGDAAPSGARPAGVGGRSPRGSADRFSAVEFALEHGLAGLPRADHDRRAALHRVPRLHDDATDPVTAAGRAGRLRVDLHHPHSHRPRSDRVVVADAWGGGPAHRAGHLRGREHDLPGDDPPF